MWTLVTGGSKRLGAAICLSLAANGFPVVVHYRHSFHEAIHIMEQCQAFGVKAAVIQGDFSTLSSVQDFIQRYLQMFPDTSGLINNVGHYLIGPALKTSLEDWIQSFQINLYTPLMLMQALVPNLIQHKGQIINIGVSGLMHQSVNSYSTAYKLTKEGLLTLTRSFARELAPTGVRVNMVSPGQLENSVDLPLDLNRLPMKRPAYCSEVCRVIIFLLDPASAYITGQNIEVAGGLGCS